MSEQIRVVVIEDDPDVAMFTQKVLEKRDCVVMVVPDPRLAVQAVLDFVPDVVITDIEMPGMTGLDLMTRIREVRPGIPVIVMTAHASLDYALTALRSQADEFLQKPVSSSDLIAHVTRLAEAARAAAAGAPQRQIVLAIGAHPNDVEIGVGGIIAAHAAAGDPVTILTLSRGDNGTIRGAWDQCSQSAAIIGAEMRLEDFTPKSLANEPLIVDAIRKSVDELAPTVVYVNTGADNDPDHRAVYDATMISTGNVHLVATYQGSSATVEFRPTRFVPIDGHLDTKLSMLETFAVYGQSPEELDPEFVRATARAWSRFGPGSYSEPLEVIRDSGNIS